ncbi:MAG: amino acid racemase [Clostridiales bacterium]|jgi:aspartate racemase|nr:amino acid racemase [Clostridiales bacterium]
MKTLGVLGGMGPLATVNFLELVVKNTEVAAERDHIRVFVDSNPAIPDRISALLHGGESPVPLMAEALRNLETIGAEVIVMPCVTAHNFYNDLKPSPGTEFINMIDVLIETCQKRFRGKTAGVLSTSATLELRTILNPLEARGVPFITPNKAEQNEITRLILNVKTNAPMNDTVRDFERVLDSMTSRGAEYFLLGCTELPVIANHSGAGYVFLDAALELARAAISACK